MIKAIEIRNLGKKYIICHEKEAMVRHIFPKFLRIKKYEEFWALQDINLEINKGECVGIIGRNGAGKTTLLNILAGITFPTTGSFKVDGRISTILSLGAGFHPELTGEENVYLNASILGLRTRETKNRFEDIIEFSELNNFADASLKTYSAGMYMRLGFSIAIHIDFDILLIDEILSVGDIGFQEKCIRQLTDFKCVSKTLIVTTQDMSLIKRLCDEVVLLDHGYLIFYGDILEGINKYQALLNTKDFSITSSPKNTVLIENTKKWSEDMLDWGKKLGTKEVMIESVDLINKFGMKSNRIRSKDPLKIKVHFTVKDKVEEPYFGIAIFRDDGVYCYGPNTIFDGYKISELKKGNGYFILNFHKLLLAPGEYLLSIAIWNKDGISAFDYHDSCYKLIIIGDDNQGNELLNIPVRFNHGLTISKRKNIYGPDLRILSNKWDKKIEADGINIKSIKFLNSLDEEKDVFVTNESVKFIIHFSNLRTINRDSYLWIGVYRDDGIYCQGIIGRVDNKNKNFELFFPKLSLLPGNYRVSVGLWDNVRRNFLMCHHAVYPFRMTFDRKDHGTVYLEHKWYFEIDGNEKGTTAG